VEASVAAHAAADKVACGPIFKERHEPMSSQVPTVMHTCMVSSSGIPVMQQGNRVQAPGLIGSEGETEATLVEIKVGNGWPLMALVAAVSGREGRRNRVCTVDCSIHH
jgi:hypothetical protein